MHTVRRIVPFGLLVIGVGMTPLSAQRAAPHHPALTSAQVLSMLKPRHPVALHRGMAPQQFAAGIVPEVLPIRIRPESRTIDVTSDCGTGSATTRTTATRLLNGTVHVTEAVQLHGCGWTGVNPSAASSTIFNGAIHLTASMPSGMPDSGSMSIRLTSGPLTARDRQANGSYGAPYTGTINLNYATSWRRAEARTATRMRGSYTVHQGQTFTIDLLETCNGSQCTLEGSINGVPVDQITPH